MPAMVKVPVRVEVLLLTATEKPTLPEPEPGVPEVIEIHAALLNAVQLQLVVDVTNTFACVAPALSEDPSALSVNEHAAGVTGTYDDEGPAPAAFDA